MAATLNEYVAIDNPLDYHTFIWNQPEKLTATFTEVLEGGFDVGMVILDMPTHPKMKPDTWAMTARAYGRGGEGHGGARRHGRLACPKACRCELAAELSAMGVAPMMGLDDALTAFEAAAFIGRNWARARRAAGDAAARSQGRRRARVSASTRPSSLLKAHGLARARGHRLHGGRRRRRGREARLSRDAQGLLRGHRPQDRSRRRGAEPAHRRTR